jgi:hypothetical protein
MATKKTALGQVQEECCQARSSVSVNPRGDAAKFPQASPQGKKRPPSEIAGLIYVDLLGN